MNRTAVAVVVAALAAALIGESIYLFALKRENATLRRAEEGRERAARVVLPAAPAYRWQSDPFVFERDPFDAWDPFAEMESIRRMMNRLFRESVSRAGDAGLRGAAAGAYEPDVDVKEGPKEYVLKIDLPGIEKDRISVKVENRRLILSGERRDEREEGDGQKGFRRVERSYGSFYRSMPLPSDADTQRMTASQAQGVLTVRIPRLEQGPRQPAQDVQVT